jgi:carboxypeptidase Q
MKLFRLSLALVLLPLFLLAEEKVDLNTIYRIKEEAFQRSKVMDHLFYLTDVHGPRLAGSPAYKRSAEWVVKTLQEYGLENVHMEKWGPFGKGWVNEKFYAAMAEPSYGPLIGFPQAWSGSTNGLISGEPVIVNIQTEADMEKYKGKLNGKIVLTSQPIDITLHERADSTRYTEKELEDIGMAQMPGLAGAFGRPQAARAGQPAMQNFLSLRALRQKLSVFYKDEGVAVMLSTSNRSDMGTVFASSGGGYNPKDPVPPAMVAISGEHYNRIHRLVSRSIPVKLEFEVRNRFIEDEPNSWNVVGDIPGGKKKNEVVLIGGHLDSWQGGTGAADNAVGSAVMMEVMRVLKKLDVKMDRTIRIGLWDAEEEGLLGSRAYVKEHYADPTTMKTTAEWDNFSAYYNVDNGSGKIRGVYLQGNEAARPVMESLLAPFKDLGASTVTIRNTTGTDHQSFDAVGLPGFQFIQDTLEYDTRTHHSNMDVYERVQRGDLMQMSAIVTSLVYHTANRDERIPRKPKPAPRQPGGMPF